MKCKFSLFARLGLEMECAFEPLGKATNLTVSAKQPDNASSGKQPDNASSNNQTNNASSNNQTDNASSNNQTDDASSSKQMVNASSGKQMGNASCDKQRSKVQKRKGKLSEDIIGSEVTRASLLNVKRNLFTATSEFKHPTRLPRYSYTVAPFVRKGFDVSRCLEMYNTYIVIP